jgi:hypothetical protein
MSNQAELAIKDNKLVITSGCIKKYEYMPHVFEILSGALNMK